MKNWDIKRTVFTVSDFLSWMSSQELDLRPPFQRRQVWKPKAKSLFIDTVYRGLPVPIIFLRERTELSSLRTIREVVDGQQRLRTIISYINPKIIPDYRPERDDFLVLKIHNKDISGLSFVELSDLDKKRLLSFQFSVDVLPSDTDDADLLEIFSRLNATGTKLNPQELRNAEFLGEFKTFAYTAAYEQLDRWRSWGIFDEDQIARMSEVELTSELFMYLISGVQHKSPKAIDNTYNKFDELFEQGENITHSYREILDKIGEILGNDIYHTVFRRAPLFYALFVVVDMIQRRDIKLPSRMAANEIGARLKNISRRIRLKDAPDEVNEATERRTTHKISREAVINYLSHSLTTNN